MEWINIKEKKPKRSQYVLVETKYCKYPATVAIWTGSCFNSIDGIRISNTDDVNWVEIQKHH